MISARPTEGNDDMMSEANASLRAIVFMSDSLFPDIIIVGVDVAKSWLPRVTPYLYFLRLDYKVGDVSLLLNNYQT